jgi:hypothetical protein
MSDCAVEIDGERGEIHVQSLSGNSPYLQHQPGER